MKTVSISVGLSAQDVRLGRFNPIAGLSPERLALRLDDFHAGYYWEVMRLFDLIERRDDTLACVVPKRKKALARRDFEILLTSEGEQDPARAERHKEALEFFYNNLIATHATDAQERGGWSLLVKQMMDSVGKKYACHEIIWQPRPDGLTAELRFVPPWHFDGRTGALLFIAQLGDRGAPLNPGEWMVTTGDGLMEASSVCYMYKRLPLRDWLVYSGRNGMPGVKGVTNAAPDSPEWRKAEEAVSEFAAEFAALFTTGTDIEPIDLTAKGELPYPALIDRMDRKLAAIWRGGDLSSMSAGEGQGQGASVQGDESDLIEQDDAAQLSGALNTQLDPWIIKYACGDDHPLAYCRIIVPEQQNVDNDLKVDEFLRDSGVPLGKSATAQRYGRAVADPATDELLERPVTVTDRLAGAVPAGVDNPVTANVGAGTASNALIHQVVTARAQAQRLDAAMRRDLADTLSALETLVNGDLSNEQLHAFQAREPELLRAALANHETRDELEKIYGTAAINGMIAAAQTRASPTLKKTTK